MPMPTSLETDRDALINGLLDDLSTTRDSAEAARKARELRLLASGRPLNARREAESTAERILAQNSLIREEFVSIRRNFYAVVLTTAAVSSAALVVGRLTLAIPPWEPFALTGVAILFLLFTYRLLVRRLDELAARMAELDADFAKLKSLDQETVAVH